MIEAKIVFIALNDQEKGLKKILFCVLEIVFQPIREVVSVIEINKQTNHEFLPVLLWLPDRESETEKLNKTN